MVAKEVVKYLEGGSKDIQVSVDATLCPYSTFFLNIKCILHICKHCGTDKLKSKLIEMNQQKVSDLRNRFLVKQWVNKNKVKNGVTQSYLNWNVDRYSYLDLINLYVQHLHSWLNTVSWPHGTTVSLKGLGQILNQGNCYL